MPVTTAQRFVNLFRDRSDIAAKMAGPWDDVRVDTVGAGDTLELVSGDVEHAAFVIDGGATLVNGDGKTFTLAQGSAFAIPKTGRVQLTSETGITFLHIVMRIDR